MTFKEYILQNRMERKLTQQALADLLGVSNTTISNYETGTSTPSFQCMLKLASIFGIPYYGDETDECGFYKKLYKAFEQSRLCQCLKTLLALQADEKLDCPLVCKDDFLFVVPVSGTDRIGKLVYYKAEDKTGIYKLYRHKDAYILLPESKNNLSPVHIRSLNENLFEIKAVLHMQD